MVRLCCIVRVQYGQGWFRLQCVVCDQCDDRVGRCGHVIGFRHIGTSKWVARFITPELLGERQFELLPRYLDSDLLAIARDRDHPLSLSVVGCATCLNKVVREREEQERERQRQEILQKELKQQEAVIRALEVKADSYFRQLQLSTVASDMAIKAVTSPRIDDAQRFLNEAMNSLVETLVLGGGFGITEQEARLMVTVACGQAVLCSAADHMRKRPAGKEKETVYVLTEVLEVMEETAGLPVASDEATARVQRILQTFIAQGFPRGRGTMATEVCEVSLVC
jgi:hypothetical protein